MWKGYRQRFVPWIMLNLSKRSCVGRDSAWPYEAADTTWLTGAAVVPWNIGQYVNNQTTGSDANVAYQELNISLRDVPPALHCFLPNIWYSGGAEGSLRLIALVSTRNISKGEEVLSNYYTLVADTKS
ncbi:SET domain-containing protein 9-like isoform X2 [Bacillus rossius redtenbacheri]|uniref:SET domain-containing protein 9-like isoform X2 n=1 Tax=Bacillus rossius redtenbacheri TaxID=93214 RepID=UPI002FDD3507